MLRYKACRNSIIILELLNDTITNEKRNNVINDKYSKFRCDKAKVISIINVKTQEKIKEDLSIYDNGFTYSLGEVAETWFNTHLDNICTAGIHYFKTKEAALSWFYSQCDQIYPDGKLTIWHENGQKEFEGTVKGGEKDGKWTGWHKNGHKMFEGTYKDLKMDGKWTYWYGNEKNQKEYEGTYKNGIYDGKWTTWHKNGNKKSKGTHKDGNRDGEWIWWDINGQIKFEETYNGGIIVD